MTGRKLGLVIGINDYSDPKHSNLHFATKDAKEMMDALLNPDIGVFDDVIPLLNETKSNVKKGIEKLFLKDATFEDLVLIYFSGHGKLDLKFKLNLILKDTETDYLLSTALNYDFITNCIEQSKCRKAVIILDCCHGGAADIKGDCFVKTLSETSGSGTFVLSATTGADLAKEVHEFENGIFTHFLLEGLKNGDADLGGDGLIDIIELYEYASKKCNDEYAQVTTIKSKFEEKIVIGRNPKKIRENEYKLKKSKLLEEFVTRLHPLILNESQTILRKNYQNPSSLEKNEIKIYNLLEALLKGELLVDNYSEAVQHLKNISINVSAFQNESLHGVLKLEIPNIENIGSSTKIEFVPISAGEFLMGSLPGEQDRYDDESPTHKVTIECSLCMSKYPITQKQWKSVMGNNPSYFKGEDMPVDSVSWEDVQEFIKKLNEKEGTDKYRLPSEAEWEYACRAGTQTRYPFGDDVSKLNEYAWYDKNSSNKTHPVGQKKPNPWGLYDMHGNVWEWVQDSWHESYEGAPSNGSAWEDGESTSRILRGGSWDYFDKSCRSANRAYIAPIDRDADVGFRLLMEL